MIRKIYVVLLIKFRFKLLEFQPANQTVSISKFRFPGCIDFTSVVINVDIFYFVVGMSLLGYEWIPIFHVGLKLSQKK